MRGNSHARFFGGGEGATLPYYPAMMAKRTNRGAWGLVVVLAVAVLGGIGLLFLRLKPYGIARYRGTEADLRGARLRHASLEGVILFRADLQGADLAGADLRAAYLEMADLRNADLRGAQLQGGCPSPKIARMPALNFYTPARGAVLKSADLRGAKLAGANLTGAYLCFADLRGANLNGANLTDAWLANADLRQATLQGAVLRRCRLFDAKLQAADLTKAVLTGADLDSFKEIGIKGPHIGATYDARTRWPAGFDPVKAGAVLAR